MNSIQVKSSKGDYRIVVGTGLLSQTGKILKKLIGSCRTLIITQENIARHFLPALKKSFGNSGLATDVFFVPDGEKAKAPSELFKIHHFLASKGYERRDCLIALGGGVVGDLTGFTAATYLRGIAYISIGTTLLAQVDSSIGGKTGVNLPEGKNLVGAFYPPKLVLSDAEVLVTLPDRELRASLAEVVKYGVIKDPFLFRLLERSAGNVLKKDRDLLKTIVLRSSKIKAGVVSRDEFETKGERLILNYGHTFGHAFEKITRYRMLLHGEAVSIGMAASARLAVLMKILKPSVEQRQLALLEKLGLPTRLSKRVDVSDVVECMFRDKKKQSGKLRFILPVDIGTVVVRDNIPLSAVRTVIQEITRR